jgi:hypothetical protein
MSKYKTMLLEYVHEKNRIIRKHTGLLLTTSRDLAEIEHEWSEEDCKRVLSKLSTTNDSGCCPWCILFPCYECKYGERNGRCKDTKSSRYIRITERCGRSILSLTEVKNLVQNTRIKFLDSIVTKVKHKISLTSSAKSRSLSSIQEHQNND